MWSTSPYSAWASWSVWRINWSYSHTGNVEAYTAWAAIYERQKDGQTLPVRLIGKGSSAKGAEVAALADALKFIAKLVRSSGH